MKTLHRRHAAVWLVVAAFVWLLAPYALHAQQAPPPQSPKRPSPSNQPPGAPAPTRNAESVNQRAIDLAMLSTVGRRDQNPESSNKRLAKQLIEDFDRLWQINTETIAPLSAAESVDYKKLFQATAEIKHRATRIKYAIALPVEDKKGEKVRYGEEAAKLGSMLTELDRAMKSFIGNPVFRINSPNDAELRSAAGRDLQAIINLSEKVKKVAKSLSKAASPDK
ncbi:MAG TPA: hypothetical protein VGV87_21830 [Blastocatellia bacterium]|nr:hypothetical protein [Blastocatellia bacterium]